MDFDEISLEPSDVMKELRKFTSLDKQYADGKILNSICTEPVPIAKAAYMEAINTNVLDNRIFVGMTKLENATTEILADLMKAPEAAGQYVSGGTEANLIALFAARAQGLKRGIMSPEVVVPESVHYSVEKVASILNMKLVYTKLRRDGTADPGLMRRALTNSTVALCATAGTSDLGIVDPIEEIGEIAREYEVYYHVDAASGGFLIPFARDLGIDLPACDFRIKTVHSITIDPHKFGLSAIPSGYILFRSQRIKQNVQFQSHFYGTNTHSTLTGTRSGAGLASTFAVIRSLGKSGYRDYVGSLFEKRDYLIQELNCRGLSLYMRPTLTIVGINSKDPLKCFRALEQRGWIVSVSKRHNCLRVVIHKHIEKKDIRNFVNDLADVERKI